MNYKETPCSRCGQDMRIPAKYNAENIAKLEQATVELMKCLKTHVREAQHFWSYILAQKALLTEEGK